MQLNYTENISETAKIIVKVKDCVLSPKIRNKTRNLLSNLNSTLYGWFQPEELGKKKINK